MPVKVVVPGDGVEVGDLGDGGPQLGDEHDEGERFDEVPVRAEVQMSASP